MKAYQLKAFGDELQLTELPTPQPGQGEVRIVSKALGINPVDSVIQGGYALLQGITLPVVLGCDVAGIVDAVGKGVTSFKVGDRVAGLVNFPRPNGSRAGGAHATHVIAPANELTLIPKSMSFVQAAALPAVGLTAQQALFDFVRLTASQRVLIHGAAGGVGHIAVQLAKNAGAYVVATASAHNHDFVRSLGADEIIDYKNQRFENIAHDIDITLNTVIDDTAIRSIQVMKPGGTLVSLLPLHELAGDPTAAAQTKGVHAGYMAVHSDGTELAELFQAFSKGEIRIHIAQTYPFSQLAEAQNHLNRGGFSGKLVVEVGA